MGGGNDTPTQPAQQTVTQTNIPDYAQPYFERMMARTEGTSNQAYQPYTGARVQGFTPNQQDAMTYIRNLSAPASLGQATTNAQTAAQGELGTTRFGSNNIGSTYQANPTHMFNAPQQSQMFNAPQQSQMFNAPGQVQAGFQPGQFNSSVASQYMDPYQQSVTDVAKREAVRQAAQQGVARDANAASKGAFGGSRAALVQTEANRGLGQQLSDIQMQGDNTAYQNAQAQYERDRQAQYQASQQGLGAQQFNSQQQLAYGQSGLQNQQFNTNAGMQYGQMGLQNQQYNSGQQMQYGQMGLQNQQYNEGQRQQQGAMGLQGQIANEQAREAAAGIQQKGYSLMNDAAANQGNLANTSQNLALQRDNALLNVGNQQQALGQRTLDQSYTNYVNQRDYPQQMLNFYSGILRGVPVQANSDVTTYNPTPSAISQIAGLGIAGLGAYGMARPS